MAHKFPVLNWSVWQEDGVPDEWDRAVQQFPEYNVFQSHAWGEHKRRSGWQVLRLFCGEREQPVAISQALIRHYPLGVCLSWMPGGPIGDIKQFGHKLRATVSRFAKSRFVYFRINLLEDFADSPEKLVENAGWGRSRTKLTSGMSMFYNPSASEDDRLKLCTSNWRHNLRRGFKKQLRVSSWENPELDEVMSVFASMQEHKCLDEQISKSDLESLFEAFGSNMILCKCENKEGRIVSLRGAVVMGDRGWDVLAATSAEGRKIYASYVNFWELMNKCSSIGISRYDMGGIDPELNRGVYNFKKGTGAVAVNYLGEWESATPWIVGPLASWYMSRKRRQL